MRAIGLGPGRGRLRAGLLAFWDAAGVDRTGGGRHLTPSGGALGRAEALWPGTAFALALRVRLGPVGGALAGCYESSTPARELAADVGGALTLFDGNATLDLGAAAVGRALTLVLSVSASAFRLDADGRTLAGAAAPSPPNGEVVRLGPSDAVIEWAGLWDRPLTPREAARLNAGGRGRPYPF